MIERSVLFPEPDGPESMVTPRPATKETSSVKPPGRASFASTRSVTASSDGIGRATELVHRIEKAHRHSREDEDHGEGLGLAAGLERVVDRERSRLRFARDVAGDHQRHAE